MELMGICNICGRADRLYTCNLCGRLVCSLCFDHHSGVCIHCSSGRKSSANHHEIHDGIDGDVLDPRM